MKRKGKKETQESVRFYEMPKPQNQFSKSISFHHLEEKEKTICFPHSPQLYFFFLSSKKLSFFGFFILNIIVIIILFLLFGFSNKHFYFIPTVSSASS
ncbi:hypothetical protein IC582_015296 [Cucumis melo]